MNAVIVYAQGLVCCSACAPLDMQAADVELAVNHQHPTGIASRWSVTDDTFKGGQPNPCACDTDSTRRHWLLTC